MSEPQNPKGSAPAVNTDAENLLPWKTIRGKKEDHMVLFRPRYDEVEHPRTGQSFKRLVLETPDWVNVVARTAKGRFVFVKQYRFGVQKMTMEIPGGMVEAGEPHGEAAKRELQEESGYTSNKWTYLGSVQPNPAFHDNLCHHWLAEGAELTAPQDMDSGEDIAIVLLTEAEVREQIATGEIAHALVHTAVLKVLDLRMDL